MPTIPAEMPSFETWEDAQRYLLTLATPRAEPGDAQLRMLRHAMADNPPACADDERFIADHLTPRHRFELAAVCRACPLFNPCRAYATRARPEAGVWAGETFERPRPH